VCACLIELESTFLSKIVDIFKDYYSKFYREYGLRSSLKRFGICVNRNRFMFVRFFGKHGTRIHDECVCTNE
jgi:hypothetical protein